MNKMTSATAEFILDDKQYTVRYDGQTNTVNVIEEGKVIVESMHCDQDILDTFFDNMREGIRDCTTGFAYVHPSKV